LYAIQHRKLPIIFSFYPPDKIIIAQVLSTGAEHEALLTTVKLDCIPCVDQAGDPRQQTWHSHQSLITSNSNTASTTSLVHILSNKCTDNHTQTNIVSTAILNVNLGSLMPSDSLALLVKKRTKVCV